MIERLDRGRHDAVVGSDDQHDEVRRLGAARAHRRERLVAGRVEEGDHALGRFDVIRADVLRDAARFAAGDASAPYEIEQRSLAVIDMAHDRYDRRPRQRFGGRGLRRFGEKRVWIVELGRDCLVAHLLDHDHRGFLIEHLIDRHHGAELHHRLDDLSGLHRHLVCQFGHADRLRHRNLTDNRFRRRSMCRFAFFLPFLMAMLAALGLLPCGRRGGGVATP